MKKLTKESALLILCTSFAILFIFSAMAADSEYIIRSALGVITGLIGSTYCAYKLGEITR